MNLSKQMLTIIKKAREILHHRRPPRFLDLMQLKAIERPAFWLQRITGARAKEDGHHVAMTTAVFPRQCASRPRNPWMWLLIMAQQALFIVSKSELANNINGTFDWILSNFFFLWRFLFFDVCITHGITPPSPFLHPLLNLRHLSQNIFKLGCFDKWLL